MESSQAMPMSGKPFVDGQPPRLAFATLQDFANGSNKSTWLLRQVGSVARVSVSQRI